MVVSGAFTQPLAASGAPQPDISAIPGRLGAPVRLLCRQCLAGARLRRAAANGARCRAFFKFKNPLQGDSESAGIYGSQSREDYSEDDVEHYFNYMGMLATEGTYDRLNSMLSRAALHFFCPAWVPVEGLAPVDLLLMMAASENDAPKVAELLRAGADASIRNLDGKCARELATSDAVFELLDEPKTAFTY